MKPLRSTPTTRAVWYSTSVLPWQLISTLLPGSAHVALVRLLFRVRPLSVSPSVPTENNIRHWRWHTDSSQHDYERQYECPPCSPRWCTTRRRIRERSASHIPTGSWWLSTCLISWRRAWGGVGSSWWWVTTGAKYRHNHSCVAPKHTEVFKVVQTQRVKSGKVALSITPQQIRKESVTHCFR